MSKKSTHYVNNKELLVEIKKYRKTMQFDENGKYIDGTAVMSDTLGRMIMKIANGLAQKPSFSGYTWIDDMKADAIFTVVKYLRNFNPEKSDNPFAYITQICYNAFKAYLNKQKKHSQIKNDLFENKEKLLDESSTYSEVAINYMSIK